MTKVNQNIGVSDTDPFYSGDTEEITITVTDGSGDPVNCTGATIVYGLDTEEFGGTPLVSKTTTNGDFSIGGDDNNEVTFTLEPSDTEGLDGTYYHEAEMVDTSSDVATLMTGKVVIKGDMV
jgi:hypothetical protein